MIKELDSLTRNFKYFKTGVHSTLKSDAYFGQKESKYKLQMQTAYDTFKSDEQCEEKIEDTRESDKSPKANINCECTPVK